MVKHMIQADILLTARIFPLPLSGLGKFENNVFN